MGRSKHVTGPYVDRDNQPMMEDGGTLILSGGKRWRGPGHCAILRDASGDKLVYHAYDANARGVSTLRIVPIVWDTADWPAVSATDSTDN